MPLGGLRDPQVSRWYKLAACIFAMMAIANFQYAWTKFTQPLEEEFKTSLAVIQWAFFVFVATQTWLLPVNAYLVDRFGARLIVSLAGVLAGLGWVGSGFAHSLPALYIWNAVGGAGAGAIYGACVGLAMKWFPDRRGVCVGSVAGAYGFGTAITIVPISSMIENIGYRPAFVTWGIVLGLVVIISAQFLSMPPPDWVPAGWEAMKAKVNAKIQFSSRNYTAKEMLKTPGFYAMYLMMMVVASSGLMATAQVDPLANAYGFDKYILFGGITVLTLTIIVDSVLNGVTRPVFGWISDQIGRYDTMFLAFAVEAIAVAGLIFVPHRPVLFVIMFGLTFFAWGEIYSLFPAAIADVFGSKNSTTNYGLLYTSKGIASLLAGPLAAFMTDLTGSWLPVIWTAAAFNLIAALLALFWLKPLVTRLVNSPEGQGAPDPPIESVEAAAAGHTDS